MDLDSPGENAYAGALAAKCFDQAFCNEIGAGTHFHVSGEENYF